MLRRAQVAEDPHASDGAEMIRPDKLLVLLSFLAFYFLGVAPAAAIAENEDQARELGRLAIVIGNSNYEHERYDDLPNASNDAVRISESLRRLNFEVATGIDLSSDKLKELLGSFEGKLDRYSAVLIFYAGHGVQIRGENFLLPSDTLEPSSVDNLTSRAIRLNEIIARFASRDRPTFIFLDACRNSPLGPEIEGAGKGLAQVEVGENTYIAFATQPGNVTVDGVGENSPFTEAMLQNIEFPGLSISDMMIRVRNATEARTLGNQVPWDQSNLREQFYFTELQVIDPQELGSTLSRILENPSMKEKLMVQLASADGDLQSTVLLLGKQLPDTMRSAESSTQQKLSGTQVAGLAPSDGLAVVEKDVASALSSLVTGGSDEDDAAKVDISRRVQTELARVGCYRKAIDGDWGPGSKKALSDYFQRTKQARTSLEPDVNLLSDLFLRSGRICRQPVAAPRPVKTATVDRGDAAAKKATAGRKPRAQRARPAAPPPDIGAGIGIGGIF
jgi:hypothetical protein